MAGAEEAAGVPPDSALTLPGFLDDAADRYGERDALRFGAHTITYAELQALAAQATARLVDAGVGKGSSVGLWVANRPEWIVALFAASAAGAVVTPISTFAKGTERDHVLNHADVALLVAQQALGRRRPVDELTGDHPQLAAEPPLACTAVPALRRIVGVAGGPAFELGELASPGGEPGDDSVLDGVRRHIAPADDAVVVYTSGTTADPKGIVHRHRTFVVQAYRFASLMELTPDDRVYSAQPLFWTAGMAMSLGATMAAGACLILDETFNAGRALDTIERERATTVHAWPHQEKEMAELPGAGQRDLTSVRRVEFSSPLARLAGLTEDTWGTYGAYGLSETFTICAALPASAPAALRRRTNGRPLDGIDLRIVDPERGVELDRGETGEIVVRGETLMRGYHKVEREHTFDTRGFFHTGDAGYLDEDGLLVWTGRMSGLVKTGGANVSPVEVEQAAADLAGLKAAAAVGVPHPTLGQALVLCAIIGKAEPPAADAIRAHLAAKLSAYKVPRAVVYFRDDEVEYTDNDKIRSGALAAAAERRLADEGREIAGHRYR